jgi:hypothetical protein
MAAVTRSKARPCTPVGYEVVDKGTLTEDVTAGDLLTLGASGWAKAATSGITEAMGIALQNGYSGQAGFSVGIQGEMDGFSGMTPGAALYPSTGTAGGLDTTAIAGATVRIRAVTASRIRYNFT